MRSDHGQEQGLPATRASEEDTQLALQCVSVALRVHVDVIPRQIYALECGFGEVCLIYLAVRWAWFID